MKERKTTFKFFTITQYEKEQEYLRKMHKNGWRFIGVTLPGFYHFEQCTPEDVIYQLDYNQEGVNHKEEYVQMFQDCGWEYLTDFVGYSYFRKAANKMKEDEGIFCDDSSRLDMMKRIFKGKMLPLLCIFFAIIIPQLYMQYSIEGFRGDMFIIFVVLFVLYLMIFISFGVGYWKFKRNQR